MPRARPNLQRPERTNSNLGLQPWSPFRGYRKRSRESLLARLSIEPYLIQLPAAGVVAVHRCLLSTV